MKVKKFCPMCMKQTEVDVDITQEEYYNYLDSDKNIQAVFPKMHPMARDFLRIGICFNCSESLYNSPAPGNEKAFGKHLGNCACCDRAVWEKDLVEGKFICTVCGSNEYEE